MSKQAKTFSEPEEKQPSLADLMANAAAVSQNVDEQEYEKSRRAAMEEFGLVEATKGAGKKGTANAEVDALKTRITELTLEAEAAKSDFSEVLGQRDDRIAELEAENAGLKAQLPAPPVIPAAPVVPTLPDGKPNPFADGVA